MDNHPVEPVEFLDVRGVIVNSISMGDYVASFTNKAFLRLMALGRILDYQVTKAQLKADALDIRETLDMTHKAAELLSHINTGKYQLLPRSREEVLPPAEETGDNYVASPEECDIVLEAIFTDVTEGIKPKPLRVREPVPSARKKVPEKPVEEEMEALLYQSTPPKTAPGEVQTNGQRTTKRTIKIRKVARLSPTRRT